MHPSSRVYSPALLSRSSRGPQVVVQEALRNFVVLFNKLAIAKTTKSSLREKLLFRHWHFAFHLLECEQPSFECWLIEIYAMYNHYAKHLLG